MPNRISRVGVCNTPSLEPLLKITATIRMTRPNRYVVYRSYSLPPSTFAAVRMGSHVVLNGGAYARS